jgi:C4-dicarboxylate transporter DctQ subunit
MAKSMMLLSHLVSFIFLAAVSFYGYKYLELVIELDEKSIDLEIPMWIPYLVIPISFAFAAYRVGEKIVNIILTPADEVRSKSEAEMLIAEMESTLPEDLLKEAHRKTGGML